MANPEHLSILKEGAEVWNKWRKERPLEIPDLVGAHLEGRDFRAADLSDADLRNANLWRANLSGAILHSANLSHVNLSSSDVSKAYLIRANLTRAFLKESDFSGSVLNSAVLRHADVRYVNFRGADLSPSILGRIALSGEVIEKAYVATDLTKADLQCANFQDANLSDAIFRDANLSQAILSRANLSGVDASGADLSMAELDGADLNRAIFRNANLRGANLKNSLAVKTQFDKADLTGCSVYGISAWDVVLDGAVQKNLFLTDEEPYITVDDLEVSQFIYLMLNRRKLRNIITTLGEKAVLILGRFAERKSLLDGMADKLRSLGYLPIIFDFERPTDRDLTETVKILAALARFVIADITNPRSVPLELQATVPDYMVPFVTIVQRGEAVFGMFDDLPRKYHWALPLLEYQTAETLLAGFEEKVVNPALDKSEKVRLAKAKAPARRSAED